jgi:hypothetical protein
MGGVTSLTLTADGTYLFAGTTLVPSFVKS